MDKARQDLLLHNKLPASMWTHFTDNTGHSQREITDFLVLRQHGGAEADKPSWDYVKQLGRIVDHDVQPGVTQRLMFGEGRVGNDDLHGGKVAIVAGIYQNCLPGQPSHPGGGTARV